MGLLEYTEWRNFFKVIEKAQIFCSSAGQTVSDHFVDVNKMIEIGKGGQRVRANFKLANWFYC